MNELIRIAAALAGAGAALAGTLPVQAYNTWCEDEPPVTVITPAGHHVTINNFLAYEVQDRRLLRSIVVSGTAEPTGRPGETRVIVHVVTPRGGHAPLRVRSATVRFETEASGQIAWGSDLQLELTLPTG